MKSPLKAKVYVDLLDEYLNVKVEFHYGEHMIDPFNQKPQSTDGPIIMRKVEGEQAIIDVLESASVKNGDRLSIEDEEGIVEFIYDMLPLLEEKADIFLTNAVKSLILPEKTCTCYEY